MPFYTGFKLVYLSTASFSIRYIMLTISAKSYIITCDPLIRILTTLGRNTGYSSKSSKVELKELSSIASFCAPSSSKSSDSSLVEPGVSWCTVVVVK